MSMVIWFLVMVNEPAAHNRHNIATLSKYFTEADCKAQLYKHKDLRCVGISGTKEIITSPYDAKHWT